MRRRLTDGDDRGRRPKEETYRWRQTKKKISEMQAEDDRRANEMRARERQGEKIKRKEQQRSGKKKEESERGRAGKGGSVSCEAGKSVFVNY